MGDELRINLKKEFKLLKKNWNWIVLILIIILGTYFRVYHIDYPAIGYHNWKEVHYLTEARNFAKDGFFKYGFFIPTYDYFLGREGPEGEHPDSFPTTSILVGIVFKLFGTSLVGARLVSIIFSLGTIIVMYLLAKKLFGREDYALIVAFITATSPLLIFFGRQVQLEPIALFFMVLTGYFFLKWKENPTMRNIVLTSASFALAFLPRYDHFTIIVPILFIFPYKKLLEKKLWKQFAVAIIILLTIPAWLLYTKIVGDRLDTTIVPEGIQPSLLFNSAWWTPIQAYLRDNYTMFGVWLAVIGLVFLIFFFYKNRNQSNRFLLGFAISIIPWVIISAKYLKGHAYHQYPGAPIFILFEAFAILSISSTIGGFVKKKYRPYISYTISLLILATLLFGFGIVEGEIAAKNRVFDTQFVGLDIAGRYILENSQPTERILHPGHQIYGVMWHSNRKGLKIPKSVEEVMEKEAEGANWVFIYQWGFSIPQKYPDVWSYVTQNYELKQIAFQNVGQTSTPIYFLLKRGGSFNESNLNVMIQNKPTFSQEYEFTRGKQIINYINI